MAKYNVKVTSVSYAIEDEDLWYVEEDQMEQERERLLSTLPQEMNLTLECDEDDLDDLVCDEITERTGWLISGFTYETR